MGGYYELKTIDSQGFYNYYYFYSLREICDFKSALNRGCAPDAIRLLVDDKYETPVSIRLVHNIFEYIYLKYFKKAGTFHLGYRSNWEKEIKEYLKKS